MPQSFLRFSLSTFWMALLLATLFPLSGWAAPDDDAPADDVLPGVVVVGFHEGTAPVAGAKTGRTVFDAAAAKHGVYALEQALPTYGQAAKHAQTPSRAALQRVYYVRFSGPQPPEQVANALAHDPHVAFAEPYFIHRLTWEASLAATPNDPQFSQMTHLPHLNLPNAWDVVKGEQGDVIIAIVDGGTDWRHPDLQANIWTNPGEIDGNGIDDDGNGYIDDVHGWNFINAESGEPGENGSPDPSTPSLPGNLAHGTLVAGVAGAVTNNGIGVAGSSWNATIMPVGTSCPSTEFICFGYPGILYAAENGADIINASWGGDNPSDFGALIIEEAYTLGAMVVTSAGNSGTDNDRAPQYPANFERVLSAGGTRKADDTNVYNYGKSVDVFAPAQQINGPLPDNAYSGFYNGTSFSSPLVAGIAALVKTQFPDLTPDQLRERLRTTADPIDAANPSQAGKMGRGRANALRAVTETNHPAIRLTDLTVEDSNGNGEIESGETITLTATFTNYLAAASNVTAELETNDAFITVTNNPASIGSLASGASTMVTFTFDMAANTPDNRFLLLNTAVTAGSYTDADVIRLVANETAVATHASNELQVSITNEGNIGFVEFADESAGVGFRRVGGRNLLFEGGLIVATGPNQVSDAVRGTASDPGNQHMDFVLEPGTTLEIINPGEITSEQGRVQIVDTAAPNPIGLSILQDSYINRTPAHESFVIFQYTLTNTTDETLSDVHVGLFFDWDLSANGQTDVAGFDASHQVGYMEDGSATFVGLKLLTTDVALSYRSIDNPQEIYRDETGGGFTEAEKWAFISDGLQRAALSQTDISQVIGAGPYRIDPGATATAGFAVILGDDLNSLLQRAEAAQTLWDTVIAPVDVSTEDPLPSRGAFALDPVYPNPLTGPATFSYHLGAPSNVRLTLYDVLGRAVQTLATGRQPPGAHTVTWDGRDYAGRHVAGGLYLARLTAQSPTTTFTDHQQVVVVW